MRRPSVPVNGFLLGIALAVGLAFLIPGPGAKGGILMSELTTQLGVVVIFLLQGILLPTEKLWEDLKDWRLHLFVQLYGFVAIPAMVVVADLAVGHHLPAELRLGFLFLAILPTTISTATVFTTQAGGSVAAAIFNTTVSNLLGIAIVPLWTAWQLAGATGHTVDVGPLFAQIVKLLFLPLVVGQALRPLLGTLAGKHKKTIGKVNTGIILFIIHAAFCNSVVEGAWQAHGVGTILVGFALVALLLAVAMGLCQVLLLRLGYGTEARVTGLFCATQKTLAAGVPMAKSLFAGATLADGSPVSLGLVLLPLMCYHPLQIVVGGWLIGRLGPGARG